VHTMKLADFRIRDRVELVRYVGLHGEPLPQGKVISISYNRITCRMDRTGKLVRFDPSDLRIIGRRKRPK
jgi:hypothetical protein